MKSVPVPLNKTSFGFSRPEEFINWKSGGRLRRLEMKALRLELLRIEYKNTFSRVFAADRDACS
jgi:hypothetical protein